MTHIQIPEELIEDFDEINRLVLNLPANHAEAMRNWLRAQHTTHTASILKALEEGIEQGKWNEEEKLFEQFPLLYIQGRNSGIDTALTLLKDFNGTVRQVDGTTKKQSSIGKIYAEKQAQRFNVWRINTEVSNNNRFHPAQYPEKLAEDHILSWSNEGDTVLDPMAGSGTTLKMAKNNNRNYIGIEISQEYIDIINKRLTPNLNK